MKLATIIGILLIAVGIVALIFNGIPYHSEEGHLNVGPVHAQIETQKEFPLPRVLGVVSAAAGVLVLVVGRRVGAKH